MGHLELEILDVRLLGADGAVVLGRWSLRFAPGDPPGSDSASKPSEGVFSLAFLRTDAGWRIVHDHTSAAPP